MNILHQNGSFSVRKAAKGYEVYRDEGVASTRVASIGDGPAPRLGITRAIAECDRRAAAGK